MLLYMNAKDFIKKYPKSDLFKNRFKDTSFVIVSNTIRKMDSPKWKNRYINANNLLFPTHHTIVDYNDYKSDQYVSSYKEQLKSAKPFLATIIKHSIETDAVTIFIRGQKEKKYRYFEILQEFVADNFHAYIAPFKCILNPDLIQEDKEQIAIANLCTEDDKSIHKACDRILKKAAKVNLVKKLSTEKGRREWAESLSKKELKKELEKRDLYLKGMSKKEMEDMLETFV